MEGAPKLGGSNGGIRYLSREATTSLAMEGTTRHYTVVSLCDTLEYRHGHPSANFCSATHVGEVILARNDWGDGLLL